MKRIVPLILILALLIATVAAETNDKATDFEQRNIELPVTATDAVTNTDVMPPQDESMAAADTTQKTDIVCVLKITTANIYTIQSLTLQFGSSACYHSCSPCASFSHPERILFENLTIVNNQYQAGVTYTGGVIPENQHLLEYRFSTTYAYDFAVSLITDPVGVAIKYGDTTNEYTDFAEKIVVMAGDVNADQSVNSADNLLVMQYISGKVSLTESQKIAADVNRDGQINAADTLQMQKYAVAKISSFWDYKTLSNTENENIDTTQIYRFRNMDTNKHLSINSITSKGAWGEYPREEASCKFKFTYLGRGLYQISLANNANTVLCMDADRRLSFMNISSAQRYKWYVEGSGQYFRLMNYSSKDQMISYHKSGEPGVGYNTYGMYWEIHTKEPQVLLDTYFDYGYAIRYSNGNTTTAANEISDLTAFINRKL